MAKESLAVRIKQTYPKVVQCAVEDTRIVTRSTVTFTDVPSDSAKPQVKAILQDIIRAGTALDGVRSVLYTLLHLSPANSLAYDATLRALNVIDVEMKDVEWFETGMTMPKENK